MEFRVALPLALILILFVGARDCAAADPKKIAEAVIAAAEKSDRGGVRAAAKEQGVSPWVVVDEVLACGKPRAARWYAEAVAHADAEALCRLVAAPPEEDQGARNALSAGLAAKDEGEFAGACKAFAEHHGPDGSILRVRLESHRAVCLFRLGKPREAGRAFEDAADAAEKIGWTVRESSLRLKNGLAAGGTLEARLRHLARLRVLPTASSRRGGLAGYYDTAGGTLHDLGQTREAAVQFRTAWRLHSEVGAESDAARTAANAGVVAAKAGDYGSALDWLSRAMTHWSTAEEKGQDVSGRPYSHVQMGAVHTEIGNLDMARGHLETAVKTIPPEEAGELADAWGQLGYLWMRMDRPAAARDALGKALAIYEKYEAHAYVGRALRLLGDVEAAAGNHAEAAKQYAAALAMASTDPWGAMEARIQLGRAQARNKQFAEAAPLLEKARSDAHDVRAREMEFLALVGLSDLALRQGAHDKARETAESAIALLDAIAQGLSDEPMARVRAQRAEAFELAFRASLKLGDAGAAFEVLDRWRARALLDALGGRDAFRHGALPADLAEAEKAAARTLARAVRDFRDAGLAGQLPKQRAARTQMEAAERAYLERVRQTRRASKRLSSVLEPTPVEIAAVQGLLRDREALVAFATYAEALGAFVLTKKKVRWVPLGSRTDHEKKIGVLLQALSDEERKADFEEVRAALVTPLGLAKDIRRVQVVPVGELSYLPWPQLLPDRDVACVPSAGVLTLLRAAKREPGRRVLAVGDPLYRRKVGGRMVALHGGHRFARLEQSGAEAKAVANAKGDVLLRRAEATEAAIREHLATDTTWRAVHFGCHGVIGPRSPAFSALAVTPADPDDGMLTALEVFGLRIRADLAVLSACDLGRGEFVRGEGLLGLPRAFMIAGVPRVIVGLWKVDDAATKALMIAFYNELRAGKSAAQSLRVAQRAVRENAAHPAWRHPTYWAAWTLWGSVD